MHFRSTYLDHRSAPQGVLRWKTFSILPLGPRSTTVLHLPDNHSNFHLDVLLNFSEENYSLESTTP